MAEKKIQASLEFNTKDAQKSANDFAKSIDGATKTLGGLEEQIERDLAALKKLPAGSKEFNKLAAEISKAKTEVANLELAFETLDMEQRFTAGLDAVSGVAGGFAAVQGATALVGVESAELEQQLLKVQAAMVLSTGIRDISTATAAMRKLNVVTKAQAVVQRVLNVVMSANPIGLIVTAIGLLAAGFVAFSDKAKKIMSVVLAPLILQFKLMKAGIEAIAEAFDIIPDAAERAAEAQRIEAQKAATAVKKAEREKLESVVKSLDETKKAEEERYDFEIRKAQAAGKSIEELEKEKLGFVLDNLAQQKVALQDLADFNQEILDNQFKVVQEQGEILGNLEIATARISKAATEKKIKDIAVLEDKAAKDEEIREIKKQKAAQDRANEAWKKAQEEKRKQEEDARKAQEEADKKEEERLKAKAEKEAQIEAERRKNLADQEREFRQTLEDEAEERFQRSLTEEEREITAVNDKYFRLIEQARQYGIDTAELEQAQADELQAIRDKAGEKELEKDRAIAEAKQQITDNVIAGAQSATKLLISDADKAEKVQKDITLAQIAIDTAKAISSLTAASQGNPLNAPTGGLAGIAQFSSGIATILANMASAAALLKKPRPQVAGTSGGSSSASSGVAINSVGNGSTIINGNTTGTPEPVKVFVTETDISSTQSAVNNIVESATVVE